MQKEIVFDKDMRDRLISGMGKLADTVRLTLGPCGRNVAMYKKAELRDAKWSDTEQKGAPCFVTNDGVTVASTIELKDPVENMGARIIREAAQETNDTAGDGTTTATVLAYEMVREGYKMIAAGANPMIIRKGIEKASAKALDEIRKKVKPVDTEAAISDAASISCGDKKLGALIGKALYTVGHEGVVNIEDYGASFDPQLEIKQGIVLDKGFANNLMATDKSNMTAKLENPYILITDCKIESSQEIVDLLIEVAEQDAALLIVAESVEKEPMGMLLQNNMQGGQEFIVINPPLYGEGREWALNDLAVQTGGKFISSKLGMSLKDVHLCDLGTAATVNITTKQTVILGGGGDPVEIKNRESELRHLVENTDYEFNRNRYKERLARFVSGIAVVKPGGFTRIEIDEQKMRIEDAVNAGRAARAEGICMGGGAALVFAMDAVSKYTETLSADEKTGARIFLNAMKAPAVQIAENAGLNGDNVVEKMLDKGLGFDAAEMQYCDLFEKGIVDPFMVTRMAIEIAVSVAGTFLTSGAAMFDAPKEEKKE